MKDNIGKTLVQAKIWIIAASVLPLSALSGLFFLYFIGYDTYFAMALSIGGTVMFFVSSVWWWWAIYKIIDLHKSMNKTLDNFEEIKDIMYDIKDELR